MRRKTDKELVNEFFDKPTSELKKLAKGKGRKAETAKFLLEVEEEGKKQRKKGIFGRGGIF